MFDKISTQYDKSYHDSEYFSSIEMSYFFSMNFTDKELLCIILIVQCDVTLGIYLKQKSVLYQWFNSKLLIIGGGYVQT